MKTILKHIFTQSGNETWSYIRIILIPPLLAVFVYRLATTSDTIIHVGESMAWGGLGLGLLSFLAKFIEDGTIMSIIDKIKTK